MTTMMLKLCGLSAGLTPALNQQTHEEARFIRQLLYAWLHTSETSASENLSTRGYKNQKQNKPEPWRRKQTKGKQAKRDRDNHTQTGTQAHTRAQAHTRHHMCCSSGTHRNPPMHPGLQAQCHTHATHNPSSLQATAPQ